MNPMPIASRVKRPQRGIAAIELALILPVLLILLTFPLYLGRLFWHYSVIERAAQDAVRYLATVPLSEIRSSSRGPALTAVARSIVDAELAELAPGPDVIGVTIGCDAVQCLGFSAPTTVNVAIQLKLTDIFFSNVTSMTIPLTVNVTSPYLGR
ncbi:pilus assembly protein [Rugamonas sp. A1-17]|nr:pilus assembly protein [Rugamonas sp. A1-17]